MSLEIFTLSFLLPHGRNCPPPPRRLSPHRALALVLVPPVIKLPVWFHPSHHGPFQSHRLMLLPLPLRLRLWLSDLDCEYGNDIQQLGLELPPATCTCCSPPWRGILGIAFSLYFFLPSSLSRSLSRSPLFCSVSLSLQHSVSSRTQQSLSPATRVSQVVGLHPNRALTGARNPVLSPTHIIPKKTWVFRYRFAANHVPVSDPFTPSLFLSNTPFTPSLFLINPHLQPASRWPWRSFHEI